MTVRITLDLTPEQAAILDEAVKRGDFREFHVIKAGIAGSATKAKSGQSEIESDVKQKNERATANTQQAKAEDTGGDHQQAHFTAGTAVLETGSVPVTGYHLVERLAGDNYSEAWKVNGPGGIPRRIEFIRLAHPLTEPEQRAIHLMLSMRHSHLLFAIASVEMQDTLVLITEFVDRTLRDRCREASRSGGVPRQELLGYLAAGAHVLDYFNEQLQRSGEVDPAAIQHDHVKPENLFLVAGNLRVNVFGLPWNTHRPPTAYAPPEFLEGKYSLHSDQYSLAVTYCELQTGQLPLAWNPAEIVAGQYGGRAGLSMLKAEEQEIVKRALAANPDDRWPSCQAFITALIAAG